MTFIMQIVENMESSQSVREKGEGDVHVENTSTSDQNAASDEAIQVEGEIFQGINLKTILAFLVSASHLLARDFS